MWKYLRIILIDGMCLGWLFTKYVFLVSIGILRLPPPQGMFLTWENKKINMLRNF